MKKDPVVEPDLSEFSFAGPVSLALRGWSVDQCDDDLCPVAGCVEMAGIVVVKATKDGCSCYRFACLFAPVKKWSRLHVTFLSLIFVCFDIFLVP